jgi:ribonuclease T2
LLAARHPARAEDSFLLALTWQPAFCETRGALAECADVRPRLVLHGLWPDWDIDGDGRRSDGDDFCLPNDGARDAIRGLDGQGSGSWPKLPAVKLSAATEADLSGVMPGAAAGLDRHEWWKHGTCSGLAADDYFATAIALARLAQRSRLGQYLTQQAGATVSRKDLLNVFQAEFGQDAAIALTLDCARQGGASELMEIRIRLKRRDIAKGLTAATLARPAKPAKGDCATVIRIPGSR